MGNAGSYPEPTTVKDILDFVALLYRDQEVYNKVCNILKEEIQVICRSTSNDFLSTFQTVMTQLKKLKYAITVGTDLGKYNDVKLYVDYVDQYAGTLIISLPMLYSATCYLACHLHKGCSSDEKGWVKHTFARNTEKTCYASCGDNVARSWLSDKSSFNNQFIRGGFSGKSIVPTSDKYLGELLSQHMTSLASVAFTLSLYGLLSGKQELHRGNLAQALIILKEFCKRVQGSDISSAYTGDRGQLLSIVNALLSVLKLANDPPVVLAAMYPDFKTKNELFFTHVSSDVIYSFLDNNVSLITELLESMHSGLTTRTLGLLGDVYETPFAYGFCFRAKLNYKPNMSVSESIVGFPINDTSSLHQLAYQMSTPFKDLLWGSLYCLIVIGVILCTAYIIIKT